MMDVEKHCVFLWSFIIRSRAGFECELSGKDGHKCSGRMEAAHIITRNVKGLKFELENGLCLCGFAHRYYTHRDGLWFEIVERLWPGRLGKLYDKKWQDLATSIDKEELFHTLLAEADKYRWEFVEYLPKIQSIEAWTEKTGRMKITPESRT